MRPNVVGIGASLVFCIFINGVWGDRDTFIGCYRQDLYLHRLDIFAGSVNECVNACAQDYFRYAVLDGSACLCTNTIKETILPADECDKPCSENHEQFCGGSMAQSYYGTNVEVAGPPQNLRCINFTDTTIILEWDAPKQQSDALNRYTVKAKLLKQFGVSTLTPVREWTLDNTEHTPQIECVDLHPGATYNITVTSYSDEHGEGGMSWIIAETEIGVPDLPPEPTVISRKDKTLTIEIPPIVNNNGPVTAVRVVVIYVDSELSQEFDESLLAGHKQASEDGTNYYITAALSNENTNRKFIIGNGLNYGGFDNVPLTENRHIHATLGVISTFKNVTKGRYALEKSYEQNGAKSPPLTLSTEDNGNSMETALIVICWIFAILLMVSVVGYVYLRLKMGPNLHRLPSDHHELTLQGPIVEVENNAGYQPDELSRKNFDQKLNEILDRIELDKKIGRNNLVLDVNNVLFTGQFGDVITGKVNNQSCQVHVVSDDMEPLDQSQFLKDLEAVRNFEPHKNVIDFYGICQTPNWLYLLFEHTPVTLKTMLIESRTPPTTNKHSFSSITEVFVLRTLFELSTAMEYLNSYKFVHRKLCSYNIYMTSDETAKISCFGATPVDSHGKTIDMRRWSAPEVIRFQHYSERSDVWSFGCLIWECCSIGGTLYASINSNDLITNIRTGIRPDHIPFILDDINQLMHNCWQLEPSERPTFGEISFTLRQLLASPDHVLSFKRKEGHLLPYYLPLLEIEDIN